MSEWQYYAGAYGHGELVLAKVQVEFRSNIGPRGAFRFTAVDKIYYGPHRAMVGLHITVADAEAGLFAELYQAKNALVVHLENEIASLTEAICRLEERKVQIVSIKAWQEVMRASE